MSERQPEAPGQRGAGVAAAERDRKAAVDAAGVRIVEALRLPEVLLHAVDRGPRRIDARRR